MEFIIFHGSTNFFNKSECWHLHNVTVHKNKIKSVSKKVVDLKLQKIRKTI